MKSYYEAHEVAYRRIKDNGFVGWGNKKTIADLGDARTIGYLKSALAKWAAAPHGGASVLDLGCGTGTTAFTMAQLGYRVTGIDISETAIEMARGFAADQNLEIEFIIGDILNLQVLNREFAVVYDSHVLHCIVFDEDRQLVLNGVRNLLGERGIFILDTSVMTSHWNPADTYDSLRFDEDCILWHKTEPSQGRGIVEVDGQHWCAQRRFYPATKVLSEVAEAGLKVIEQQIDKQGPGQCDMLRMVLCRE